MASTLSAPGPLVPGLDPTAGAYLAAGAIIAVVVVASRGLARRSGVPYPVFLVVAGAAASYLPGVGNVTLDPRVVFLGFLPPLVYHAGLVSSPRELRANALPIGLGALGLVLVTTFAVAGVAWAAAPVLGFTGAFVLGSVVAPTDPVAATSVFTRLGAPPWVTTVLEGESLVNDGIALALFGIGVESVAHPTGAGAAVLAFLRVAAGGTAFGLVVGWLVVRAGRPIRDPASRIVVSLLVPFVAYLPADALGLSGVLATLATGLAVGRHPTGTEASGRVRMTEFWQVLVFLLESVLFVLVGLQLRHLLSAVGGYPALDVALLAVATILAVVAARMLWWLAIPTLRWRPEGRLVDTGGIPWMDRVALGWSGLRGAISLAAALSIPAAVSGQRFPGRDLVVFTTFCVVLATLVGQGTTLRGLVRRLGIGGDELERQQRALAERRCSEAALRLVDELSAREQIGESAAEMLRERYEGRIERAHQLADPQRSEPDGTVLPQSSVEDLLLTAQHGVLHELHRNGEITNSVLRAVRHELDLEHARLERRAR